MKRYGALPNLIHQFHFESSSLYQHNDKDNLNFCVTRSTKALIQMIFYDQRTNKIIFIKIFHYSKHQIYSL